VLADSPTYYSVLRLWRFRAKPESLCLAGRKQESFGGSGGACVAESYTIILVVYCCEAARRSGGCGLK
jgi:hypothetical protein